MISVPVELHDRKVDYTKKEDAQDNFAGQSEKLHFVVDTTLCELCVRVCSSVFESVLKSVYGGCVVSNKKMNHLIHLIFYISLD